MVFRITCSVSGRVQGVSFRFFVLQQAQKLNCVGTVRNCPDDTVEVVAEGEEKDIETFISALEHGTGYSHIENIRTKKEPIKKRHFADFKIIF